MTVIRLENALSTFKARILVQGRTYDAVVDLWISRCQSRSLASSLLADLNLPSMSLSLQCSNLLQSLPEGVFTANVCPDSFYKVNAGFAFVCNQETIDIHIKNIDGYFTSI